MSADMPTRDTRSGRYAHSKLDRLCICEHRLGEHTAAVVAGQRDCLVEGCQCTTFRAAKGRQVNGW